MSHVFSVDVEDYFQVTGFESFVDRARWSDYELRVEASTDRLLELLARHQVRGVFYILGWVAEHCPDLVRRIAEAGHLIGSHTYWHHLIYNQSAEEFAQDLARSCEAIQGATGVPVRHFRAPSFSITRRNPWAVDVLVRQGIVHDSSVFPIRHDRYGMPEAPLTPFVLEHGSTEIEELPMTVLQLGRQRLPVAGGGYFRLYPWWFTRWALRQVERAGRSINFYIHPWEVDPGQPRQNGGSRATRFRHYVGLKHTEAKLDRLLRTFRFGCELPESPPNYRFSLSAS